MRGKLNNAVNFPVAFIMTFSKNYWSNLEKSVESCSRKDKDREDYPKEQRNLVIIDTFKGQNNETLKSLLKGNNFEVVVLHNLTDRFQQLESLVNKPSNSSMTRQYTQQMPEQLKRGTELINVKVALKLSLVKA